MPAETVEWIMGRALTDLAYRQRLLGSPDEALVGYDLTAEQTIEIKAWTRQQFDELIHWLDEKVSQAVFNGSLGFEFDKGLDRRAEKAAQVLIVDVTLPEIADAGLCVVRVIIPGMIPLTFGHQHRCQGARGCIERRS